MAKRNRSKHAPAEPLAPGEVGPRQPCPCGSGKRYKVCHGAPGGAAPTFVARPFEGLASEADIVAMRELVPAASAPLTLVDSDRVVRLCTLLPGATPALVRESGEILLALQVQHNFGDPARDLGAVLTRALEAETGGVGLTSDPGPGVRLQDLITATPLEITVHDGFEFWFEDEEAPTEAVSSALERANTVAYPTARLSSVTAAYWTHMGAKEHLRWVMPGDEEALLSALARLHAAGESSLIDTGRLVGMFRAHGVLAPVWDLPVGTGAEVLEGPAQRFAEALAAQLSDTSPLTAAERSARAGLATRQVTLR